MTIKIIEKIKCPCCGEIVNGEIINAKGLPYYTYQAFCNNCNYFIGESEWEKL